MTTGNPHSPKFLSLCSVIIILPIPQIHSKWDGNLCLCQQVPLCMLHAVADKCNQVALLSPSSSTAISQPWSSGSTKTRLHNPELCPSLGYSGWQQLSSTSHYDLSLTLSSIWGPFSWRYWECQPETFSLQSMDIAAELQPFPCSPAKKFCQTLALWPPSLRHHVLQ